MDLIGLRTRNPPLIYFGLPALLIFRAFISALLDLDVIKLTLHGIAAKGFIKCILDLI